ncbi:hypothetical protein [Methanocrinis sp.]|uniref:hypothetical protein n=1 Tax=Methanocrinis sp. TaxID=3101522 RepID=UPI003D0E7F4B
MFKLGEYDEFEAADIAAHLKEAGMRVELKPFVSAFVDSAVYLEGRASELRERIDDFEVYDRYIGALKAVLAEEAKAGEFTDRYLHLLDPSWKEKREAMAGFLEGDPATLDEASGPPEEMMGRAADLLEVLEAIHFMENALELNEIKIEIEDGSRGELGPDPLLRIPIEPDEADESNEELIKTILAISFEKQVEVRLDEMATPLIKNVDDEFADEHVEEYYVICSMGMIIDRLLDPPGDTKKIDQDEFREHLAFEEEMEDLVMMVDGTAAAEEIARALKKERIIKIKGDKIAWKR